MHWIAVSRVIEEKSSFYAKKQLSQISLSTIYLNDK